MKGKKVALIAAAVAVWFQLGGTLPKIEGFKLPNIFPAVVAPATPIPEPATDLKALVAPVGASLRGHSAEAALVASLFTAHADIIARPEPVNTTGKVRELVARSGPILGANLAAKVPGLADTINAAMKSALGDEDAALDAAKRQRAVDTCRAIAWAAQNAG